MAFNNCEHFVTKCATGVSQSRQVDSVVVGVAAGVVKASGYGNVLRTLSGKPASISDLVQRHRSDNSNSLEMNSSRFEEIDFSSPIGYMPPKPERSFIDTFLFKESPKEASGLSLMDQMWLNKFSQGHQKF